MKNSNKHTHNLGIYLKIYGVSIQPNLKGKLDKFKMDFDAIIWVNPRGLNVAVTPLLEARFAVFEKKMSILFFRSNVGVLDHIYSRLRI